MKLITPLLAFLPAVLVSTFPVLQDTLPQQHSVVAPLAVLSKAVEPMSLDEEIKVIRAHKAAVQVRMNAALFGMEEKPGLSAEEPVNRPGAPVLEKLGGRSVVKEAEEAKDPISMIEIENMVSHHGSHKHDRLVGHKHHPLKKPEKDTKFEHGVDHLNLNIDYSQFRDDCGEDSDVNGFC